MILTQRLAQVLLPATMLLMGLTVVPSTQVQAAQEPYWEYVRTEYGVVPYDSSGCYQPTVHSAKEGLVEITVTHCGNPPEAQTTLRMEWTKPPRILYPGQPFGYQVKTTLIGNRNPNWVLNGYIYMRPEVVSDKRPFGGGAGAEVRKGTPPVVIWDNLRRPANEQQKAPPAWWATNTQPNSMIRLSFVSVFSNEHWWTYIYRYVDPAQSDSGSTTLGYQLYFDGKLVSGPDAATYTREQAEQNCRWNMQDKPNLAIRCLYNGSIISERERSSASPPRQIVRLQDNWNTSACDFTDEARLSLTRKTTLDRIELWYNWRDQETEVPYTLLLGKDAIYYGNLQRSSCDSFQSSWCVATEKLGLTLPAGDYLLRSNSPRLCQNSTSGGNGFIRTYGSPR